ncbi:MAG TPA: hypothetical protein VFY14_04680 [Streptomyces sp.]|nr:hypothetical protein [Streptomyces sp.]
MFYAVGALMVLAGLVVATNLWGAADRLSVHLFAPLVGEGGGIGKVRAVGVVWILIGITGAVFMTNLSR